MGKSGTVSVIATILGVNNVVEGSIRRSGNRVQAILCGYLGDESIAAPIAALYDWVGANPAPAATGEPFDCEVLRIEGLGATLSVCANSERDGQDKNARRKS